MSAAKPDPYQALDTLARELDRALVLERTVTREQVREWARLACSGKRRSRAP
jgi:hypothetical protein